LRFHLLEVLVALRRAFLARGHTTPDTVTRRAERLARLNRVLEYVAGRAHGAVPQPEVARFAGMSTSRFRAFFKETTGWGFGDYLRDLRLERAAQLLRETTVSIADVACQTGFADQSHLQRLFKAKHDISPLAYRRRHQAP
jgi:transcriptional regulator GlxA family with amidase domain